MDLMIDIGNSKIKYGGFVGNQIQHRGCGSHADFIREIDKIKGTIGRVLLCSVKTVPKELLCQLKARGLNPEMLDRLTMPFTNTYSPPTSLGADRMALVAGGLFTFPGKPVLIVDLGTCMTFDFIESGGTYLGGAISLGLHMRLKALQNYTDKLPLVELSNPKDLLGINTKESILSGVVMGMTEELQGTIDAYKKRYSKIIIILTGGDASFFDKKLKSGIFADADLLLKGMNFILTHNADIKS